MFSLTIEAVEELPSELTSSKTTERKAALKKLKDYLELPDVLLSIDETTQSLSQNAQLTARQASWPALCHSLCKCVSLELASNGETLTSPPWIARCPCESQRVLLDLR